MAEIYDSAGNVKGYPDPPTSQIHNSDGSAARAGYGDLVPKYGVEWDKASSDPALTRLGSAEGMTQGSDFSSVGPWGLMRRCNLNDDGTVANYHGDSGYTEDGSNGQVMVEIPKFYYKVVNETGYMRWWISPENRVGYSVHPAFVRGGTELDYIYPAAYEATVYDDSASSYVGDGITYDYSNDIMASVADLQPISGNSDNLDILEARQLASNRGSGWAQHDYLTRSAWTMLAVVEFAHLNFQTQLSEGITNLDNGSGNHSQNTGHTSSLGNSSGEVVIGTLENGATGADETYACSYRGIENPYGNIWKFCDGIYIKDDGYYYENDPANWGSDETGYTHVAASPITSDGYIDSLNYLAEMDWIFFADSVGGSSSTYLCDYQFSHDSGETNIVRSGGIWLNGALSGLFCLGLDRGVGYSVRGIGSRLEYLG